MIQLSLLLASLFTLYIGFVYPFIGYRNYQILLRKVAVDPAARSRFYRLNMVNKWLWLIVIGIILLLGSVPLSTLGLQAPASWESTLWPLAEIVIILPIASLVQVRIIAKKRRDGLLQHLFAIKEFLPHTSQERLLWLFVSITAGICEEIIFRGFLPWYFLYLGPFLGFQISYLAAVLLSTILFGCVHLYQGWKGVLMTALAGGVLVCIYAYTGSLILPIVVHILIDVRIILLAPTILKPHKQNEIEQVK